MPDQDPESIEEMVTNVQEEPSGGQEEIEEEDVEEEEMKIDRFVTV